MKRLALCAIAGMLLGCASTAPYRTELVEAGKVFCPSESAAALPQCAKVTPESGKGYELHFVEFDDQGWAAALPANNTARSDTRSETQTDHLMKRLEKLLSNGEYVNIVLYVHGWQHSAKGDDEDVQQFRNVLSSVRTLQHSSDSKKANRKVIGIYIGWRGRSWMFPGIEPFSFWSRKNTALRVSHGAVQELFARLRSVQQHYNTVHHSPDCVPPKEGTLTTGGCRVRTLMIGHSFGAWILYSAMSAQIIAALNAEKDLNEKAAPGGEESATAHTNETSKIENRRPAEMIVLINPAFEAVRYQPVHRAAINYKSKVAQPPLLVTISTSGDTATRTFFPVGRLMNSIFQRPTTSVEQAKAMTRTHGNFGMYHTHRLTRLEKDRCEGWQPPGPLSSKDKDQVLENKRIEIDNSRRFFERYTGSDGLLTPWVRDFCGGVQLSLLESSDPNHNRDANSLVWNIRTDASIIPNHSAIEKWRFLEFVRQLYADTDWRVEPAGRTAGLANR
ncbi:hypothetical protein [Massilia sp. ST3]|uniref:hypothetical protein n=1 Tax=Massilia sp. ST3 TaxID=2824903 RepID=UPI001B822CDE|nr:hypothetical protein [Massilia sp. ST3]MBQ5950232.1 hypothetical protein [Massilia sp. ST3]